MDLMKRGIPTVAFDYRQLDALAKEYGDAFYVLHVEQFKRNYQKLRQAFSSIYPRFNIAYSYKTNYMPRLAQIVDAFGGFAEVVSDMEMNIALAVGVNPEKIIFNGPYKKFSAVKKLLFAGGTVNIDSVNEFEGIKQLHLEYPEIVLNLGIRVNFAINDGVLSRFGIDVESEEFRTVLSYLTTTPGLHFKGLNVHFATRSIETWRPRAVGMLHLIDALGIYPERIDLGGGLYGNMAEGLKGQFEDVIPTYADYAREVATVFAEYYKGTPINRQPLLLIEPGSALVGDCMSLVSRVQGIKTVRNKAIVTLLASVYNINMGKKNPPLRVVENPDMEHHIYNDLDFAGFTCVEPDYIYRGYNGPVAVGDFVVIDNVGSYSIVFKPPFILPNFAVIGFREDGSIDQIKRPETFDDLFQTYDF